MYALVDAMDSDRSGGTPPCIVVPGRIPGKATRTTTTTETRTAPLCRAGAAPQHLVEVVSQEADLAALIVAVGGCSAEPGGAVARTVSPVGSASSSLLPIA